MPSQLPNNAITEDDYVTRAVLRVSMIPFSVLTCITLAIVLMSGSRHGGGKLSQYLARQFSGKWEAYWFLGYITIWKILFVFCIVAALAGSAVMLNWFYQQKRRTWILLFAGTMLPFSYLVFVAVRIPVAPYKYLLLYAALLPYAIHTLQVLTEIHHQTKRWSGE